jgi:hypothetical protein
MESSRDSSIWRNLAVTFGGGLALGAVGMKLTQSALRPVEVTPRPEPNPVTDRLSVMERRLERMEQTPPVAAPPAPASPIAAAPIDQKVLEAVIGAVDARLQEHAGQMGRRLADLEARMAVMQGVQQQDRQASEQLSQDVANLRSGLEPELRYVRESISQALDGRLAAHEQKVGRLVAEVKQSVETRIVTAAAAAAAAQLEEQLAPLRAEVQQKEKELAELRQRLAESESSVLDVILAIGDLCRQAADRMGHKEQPPAAPPPAPAAPIAEPRPTAVEAVPLAANPGPIAVPPPNAETLPVPRAAADPALAPCIPDFLHETDRRSGWRIPLVSSFLVSTGYLLLMHYLSAPLQ